MPEQEHNHAGNRPSNRAARRLLMQASQIFDASTLSNEEINKRFSELGQEAIKALNEGSEERSDLARLASLISQADGSITGVDGTFSLSSGEDEMFMSISVVPALGNARSVTVSDITDELKRRGIQRGVLLDAIKRVVADAEGGIEVTDQVIVRGLRPVEADPASLLFYGRNTGGEIEEVGEERLVTGTVFPVLCKEHDVIAKTRPGKGGRDGYTATGKNLPCSPPKPVDLEPGKNVQFAGGNFTAAISGVVLLKDNVIDVQQALVFNGDVAQSTGPISFAGSVYVHGGVCTGVVIEATESVVIDRLVEGASIRSINGDVILHAGIAGRCRGNIRAGRDFIGGFVENASIQAGHDIRLHVGSLNSQLTADHDVIAETNKGNITGGVTIAGNCIRTKCMGSYGTTTTVICGAGPKELPILREISEKAIKHQTKLGEVKELIGQFERLTRNPNDLSPDEIEAYTNLQKLRVILEHELSDLSVWRNDILQKSVSCLSGDVKIYRSLGPNVVFHIGPLSYTSPEMQGPLTICYDTQKRRITSFRR